MNEKAERYLKLVKKHLDRIVIAIMYLFVAALVVIWFLEQGTETGSVEAGTPAKIPDPIATNPSWKVIKTMAEPQQLSSYPGIQQIRQYNMFDYKSVKGREELERQINQQFAQAQDLAKSGKKDEAVKLLKGILAQRSTYKPASDLLDQLEPKKETTGAATPAPGQ